MKNVFRIAASTLIAISVAWLAVAATPAEAYDYDYGYTYDYGYSDYGGYDYGYTYDYGSSGANAYDYDYGYGYTYDYSNGSGYDYNYDYTYDYANAYDYDYGYTYDYSNGAGYDYDYGGYEYAYGSDDYGGYDYNYGNSPVGGYGPGYNLGGGSYSSPLAFNWGGNGGCTGSSCNGGNGGCSGSSCNGGCTGSSCDRDEDLDVECIPADSEIEIGDRVTFRAEVDGGDGTIRYDWSGDANGTDRTVSRTFTRAGTYEIEIKVTDRDGDRASDTCVVEVEDDDCDEDDDDCDEDFDVQCIPSDRTIDEGDCVTYRVEVDGGDSPFEYDWNGDLEGNRNDDERTIRVCYDDAGDYEVSIVVEDDDGNRESDTCEVEVDNDRDNDNDRNVRLFNGRDDGPSGTLASVDSVYLSQIPYTGPEETAALVAAGLAVIGLGFGAAVSLKKRSMRQETAGRIAAFKAANLAKKSA